MSDLVERLRLTAHNMSVTRAEDIKPARGLSLPELLREAADALERAEWRQIESAPKDGTRIMIWDGAAHFARWSEECEFGAFKQGPGWQIFDSEDDSFYAWGTADATHWKPVPDGPHVLSQAQDKP